MNMTKELKKELQTAFPEVIFSVKKVDDRILVQPGTPKNLISLEVSEQIKVYCDNVSSFHGISCDKNTEKFSDNLLCQIGCISSWLI